MTLNLSYDEIQTYTSRQPPQRIWTSALTSKIGYTRTRLEIMFHMTHTCTLSSKIGYTLTHMVMFNMTQTARTLSSIIRYTRTFIVMFHMTQTARTLSSKIVNTRTHIVMIRSYDAYTHPLSSVDLKINPVFLR